MKFIDSHTHIGGKITDYDMTEKKLLDMIDKYSIDYCIVSNCDCAEVDGNQKLISMNLQVSQEDALIRTVNFAKKYPNKIGVAVWVKPLTQKISKNFINLIQDNIQYIKAIKLHPFHSNISPIDSRCIPYLELASRFNIPIISHTADCENASVKNLFEAAKMFPEIPFIMAHMGLGTDNKEALDLLGKADNLYGDTTWVPMNTTLEAIKRYGSNKILFGSDSPIDGIDTYVSNSKGEKSIYQDYFNKLPKLIESDSYKDIMYKNAKRIFNI